jgi:hypothetical protein
LVCSIGSPPRPLVADGYEFACGLQALGHGFGHLAGVDQLRVPVCDVAEVGEVTPPPVELPILHSAKPAAADTMNGSTPLPA